MLENVLDRQTVREIESIHCGRGKYQILPMEMSVRLREFVTTFPGIIMQRSKCLFKCCVVYLCLLFSLLVVFSMTSPNLFGNVDRRILQRISGSASCDDDIGNCSDHFYTLSHDVETCCKRLESGNPSETKRVRELQNTWHTSITDEAFLQNISNCKKIVPTFHKNFYSSSKEKNYPLGFVILITHVEHSIQQYIRLLRFIYRPQNVYCIHIDKKSPNNWTKSVTTFASCFSNILIAKDAVEVTYAHVSILTAHLNCWKELSYSPLPWNYLIDLHGNELPLVTNREMVEALEPLNGINAITSGITINRLDNKSIIYRKFTRKAKIFPRIGMRLTDELLGPVPFNLTMYKSADSPNSAFSRKFVHFALTDNRAIALFNYLQNVLSAVEFFFNTLNNLPDAPGGKTEYNQRPKHKRPRIPQVMTRHWDTDKQTHPCDDGKYRHRICLVSASDLHWLRDVSLKNTYFFMNKYMMDYDHIVMDCMEELLLKRNLNEYETDYSTRKQIITSQS